MRFFFRLNLRHQLAAAIFTLCGLLSLGVSCAPAIADRESLPEAQASVSVILFADGETTNLTTAAQTVGEALVEAGISLSPFDEVDPPATSLLTETAAGPPLTIRIVRVTEALEVIPETIPFERRIVRSAEMSPDDPPRILQTGKAGLQEISLRIVFRDGLEVERWPTAKAIIEPPVDEIVMVGVGSDEQTMAISGRLAYLSGGRAILLQGSTNSPRQLPVEGQLDGRVFQLSPGGNFLLYTTSIDGGSDQSQFRNELWVTPTGEGGEPQPLAIGNVLWAGWDPSALDPLRIAYTTARSVPLPPGWEANNDLWLLEFNAADSQPVPVRLIATYPATYGWWGGNYAWSPTGDRIAYAFSDEVGLISMPGLVTDDDSSGFRTAPEPARSILSEFTAFDTEADWAWVPNLSWSVDGRHLTYSEYDAITGQFQLSIADTISPTEPIKVEGGGIWTTFQWSPDGSPDAAPLAFLRAADAQNSEESVYELWLAAPNGTLIRQLYPSNGEAGEFARSNQSIAWGPDANAIVFIFEDELHILDITTGDLFRAESDDTTSSYPTWAPYGAAANR